MTTTADTVRAPAKAPLGEELPIFCELCGYSLHGLAQIRCAHCEVLYFHCPECGHRQPINTLRPAVHQLLGRMRAFFLAIAVLLKLFAMFWLLMAWLAMGAEWSYTWQQVANPGGSARATVRPVAIPRPVDLEQTLAFVLLGLGFGMVARMLLLRWKRGYFVGIWLSALMLGAVCIGILIQREDRSITTAWPWSSDFVMLLALTGLTIVLGASVVWWIWSGLLRVFLPTRVAESVVAWQTFQSSKAGALARE